MGQRYIEVSMKKIMIIPIQLRDYVCDKPIPEDSYEMMDEDDEFCEEFQQVYSDSNVPDANDFTPEMIEDTYLNMYMAIYQ